MFSTFLFYHFPSPPSLPCLFLIFLSVFLSCFIYKICSLVSFLIAPLGYLISIKYLCRYSRTTEENHLSFILCEVTLSLVVILNILLFICDFVYSAIPCDQALFQCSVVMFDLLLCHSLSTQGASDFVNTNCITQHPTFVSLAVTHQSQVLVWYFCLVHCTLQASACISPQKTCLNQRVMSELERRFPNFLHIGNDELLVNEPKTVFVLDSIHTCRSTS